MKFLHKIHPILALLLISLAVASLITKFLQLVVPRFPPAATMLTAFLVVAIIMVAKTCGEPDLEA